jgi:FADH2 O2-dependent halogenase
MTDVIIIGGGPAGSAMGCYLSKMGIKNLILEKEMHPRAHVGESMVTSTTRIFDEIGFLPFMEKAGFPKKYGASWHEPGGKEFFINFDEFQQPGINQPYTYHVDRSKLDLHLLKHAQELGSEVIQGVSVQKVLLNESQQAVGVQVKFAGQLIDIPAKMVVDASGRGTVLGRQLNTKQSDPIFNQYAVHAWFKNVHRSQNDHTKDFIHIYFLPVERGWAWQIPITDEITSVGIVVEREVFRTFKGNFEEYFNHYVKSNLGLSEALKNAVRVNEFKTEGDYSYSQKSFVGDGYLMIGDAARFVDPIFSSGVSIALYSAKYASEVIKTAFEKNDFSKEILMPYQETLKSGADIWYEFIRLYYKLLPLFTHFIQSKKYRVQILRLLQGEVFNRGEVEVLEAMRNYILKVEKMENHIFHNQLSNIPIDEIPETILAQD